MRYVLSVFLTVASGVKDFLTRIRMVMMNVAGIQATRQRPACVMDRCKAPGHSLIVAGQTHCPKRSQAPAKSRQCTKQIYSCAFLPCLRQQIRRIYPR